MENTDIKYIAIPENLIMAIVQYLEIQPYREVIGLIQEIGKTARNAQPTEAAQTEA